MRRILDPILRLLGLKAGSGEVAAPFSPATQMIASPQESWSPENTGVLCAPEPQPNVAKAIVNCTRKGRLDLAEAVFRGFGYGETTVSVWGGKIVANTSIGTVRIDTSLYPYV
ncbi:MAG: hypothetical protein QXI37_00255 [Thermoprotei archaeon]